MSRRSLADLKKHLAAQEEKKTTQNSSSSYDLYPFWKMNVGQHARIRILADKNEENANIFFIETFTHQLSIGTKKRNVTCLSQFGEKCPICELSRAYYKQEGDDSKNGKYYYRKKAAMARILVLEDPLPPNAETGETYKGKVIKTRFGHQLLQKMLAQMTDKIEPMTNDPWDVLTGNDFIIKKSNDGKYDVYDLESRFITSASPIAEEYLPLVNEEVDYSIYIPANPGVDKVEKLLSAHQTGEDLEDGDHEDDDGEPAVVQKVSPQKTTEEVVKTVEAKETSVQSSVSENDIRSKIKNRFGAKG